MNRETESALSESIDGLAYAIKWLGNADASTPMGGMEALGKAILDAATAQSVSIDELSDVLREAIATHSSAIRDLAKAIHAHAEATAVSGL